VPPGSRTRILADVSEGRPERGAEASSGGRGEVADEAGAGSPELLDGHLDAELVAGFAVVEDRDGPGHGRPLVVTFGMVVEAVIHQFLHPASQALRRGTRGEPSRIATAGRDGRSGRAAAAAGQGTADQKACAATRIVSEQASRLTTVLSITRWYSATSSTSRS
jgi:hypothetical protein